MTDNLDFLNKIQGILGTICRKTAKESAVDFDRFINDGAEEKFGLDLSDEKVLRKECALLQRIAHSFFVICEVKKASPSKGIIREKFNPLEIAREYERAGASALSVLTEKNYFLGSRDFLSGIREITSLPLLRKDFIFHPFQIYESQQLGADMLLLIAACLPDGRLKKMYDLSRKMGILPLIEVHTEEELEYALSCSPVFLGINNRNLITFEVNLHTSLRLIKKIPAGIKVISESGIETPDDIKKLRDSGFHGALIGTSLMRQPDIAHALSALLKNIQE